MGHEPIFYARNRCESIEQMIKEDLKALLKSGTEALGFVYVGHESVSAPRQTILRVYVDTAEGGINISECAKISKHLTALLKVEDIMSGKFALEVSSPGINRLLFELADYERFVGESIKIRLHTSIQGVKNFTGVLERVDNEMLVFIFEDQEWVVPFHTVKKANVILGG